MSCEYNFEMFQKMTDEPIKKCPKCKGEVKRLLGAGAGPIFKGSGFYHTDYKKSKAERKTEKPEPPSSKGKEKI